MLFMRWKEVFCNRYADTDCYTLISAMVLSVWEKAVVNRQLRTMKLNEGEEQMKNR